jgi:hypothetical protein
MKIGYAGIEKPIDIPPMEVSLFKLHFIRLKRIGLEIQK